MLLFFFFLFICLRGGLLWCPLFSVGDAIFPFILQTICRYVGFLNSFPLAMQHFNSFALKMISLFLFFIFVSLHCWCPPAIQHFYSFVSHVVCLLWFAKFGACLLWFAKFGAWTVGIRPFPLSSVSIHLFSTGYCYEF